MIKKIRLAVDFWSRFKGLILKDSIAVDEALLFLNCSRVHTCFMKFDICVVYLDDDLNKIDYEVLRPWKVGRKIKGTKHLLETSSKFEPYVKNMSRITIKIEGGYNG